MKYKDYYQILGLERTATLADIKNAYRKLAHKTHPDVSEDPQGEEKFKGIAEAYSTLKNPEKREEYDKLGQRSAGEDFAPPPEWQQQYGADAASFDDVDIADLLNAFRFHGRSVASAPSQGENYSVSVAVPLEKIYHGGETDVSLELPEYDEKGLPHRVPRTFRIKIPKGAVEGQRLRLAGKGGPGNHGGKSGDLYIVIALAPHDLFRVSGRDLSLDVPIAAWEAALGASIMMPTLGGNIELKIKPGSSSGQRLRIPHYGLPKFDRASDTGGGDLYAVIKIVVPKQSSQAEQDLYQQLASVSEFRPRAHFNLKDAA